MDSLLSRNRGLLSPDEEKEFVQLLGEAREQPDDATDEEGNAVEAEPLPVRLVKLYKVLQLKVYDKSAAVNGFIIGGKSMWLTPNQRANFMLTIEAAQEQGVESVPFAGTNLPVATALAALKAINLYAMQCVAVTDAHEAAIRAKRAQKTIEEYDFTAGYPAKLTF